MKEGPLRAVRIVATASAMMEVTSPGAVRRGSTMSRWEASDRRISWRMDNFRKTACTEREHDEGDTTALILLEREARDYNFSQRLPERWPGDNVADAGAHAASGL
jgi:hypothetical protein